jgi:hypothetical protein
MEKFERTRKGGGSLLRLLAAALAGAIGAFAMPAAPHRADPSPQSTAATASIAADSNLD